MAHYFISCLWGQDPERIDKARNFVSKYPQVILLEGEGQNNVFIDYVLINRFIRTVGLGNIKSLTIIDSDLSFDESLFGLLTRRHELQGNLTPLFLTYRHGYQVFQDNYYFQCSSLIYNKIHSITEQGHSGYMLSFNNCFLKQYPFNEKFVHGGYDYFLVNAILGRCMTQFRNEFLKVPSTVYDYIEVDVYHYYHERNRKTPWEKYDKTIS